MRELRTNATFRAKANRWQTNEAANFKEKSETKEEHLKLVRISIGRSTSRKEDEETKQSTSGQKKKMKKSNKKRTSRAKRRGSEKVAVKRITNELSVGEAKAIDQNRWCVCFGVGE